MNNLQIKKNIRFIKIEQPTAWIIAAVLVEIRNGQAVPVSDPKIVKIIPKAVSIISLPAPKQSALTARKALISSYYSFFGVPASHVIPWFSAQPPTV